jgi:hypothetical protein
MLVVGVTCDCGGGMILLIDFKGVRTCFLMIVDHVFDDCWPWFLMIVDYVF